MFKATKSLIRLVERSSSEQGSGERAKHLISQGADIKALTSNGPMIHCVIAEEKRQRLTMPLEADNCLRLIQVLEKAASDLLSSQVFSENGADLQEMRLLVNLKGNCYQLETYGPLGLLGSLVNQDKVPIQVNVVQFLMESDLNMEMALIAFNEEGKNCLSLAKTNPKCPKDVIDYIQQQLDEIINQIPFTQPQINPNQVIAWIRSGANIEATDKNGNTILSNAASTNNLELVRALVSAGSNTTHKNKDGLIPLQIAKKTVPRNPPLIAYLEGQSVNVELGKLIETRKSALTMEEVQRLLENGANINASMTNSNSALHLLIANQGTTDMVKTFINDFNADLAAINSDGYRPIETCILIDKKPYPYLQTILTLPKMTIDKFRNPTLNKTLLQFAIERKRSDAAHLIQNELNLRLWNCIARANTNDDNNKTIADTVTQLISYGAQINHLHTDEEYDQWTVLHLATKVTTVRMLRYLIKQLQADSMLQNNHGEYPISIAARFGHLSTVEYLHSILKSDLNVRNKDMETPLHLATKHNHLLVVRYLVKWGADDQAQNSLKQTPLDIARQNVTNDKEEGINNKKIIEFLTQLVCPRVDCTAEGPITQKKPTYNLDACDLPIPVPLQPISMNTYDDDAVVGNKSKKLFSTSPNFNLHEAAKNGNIMLARKAIGEGADIRYRSGGRTPIEVALMSQNDYAGKSRASIYTAIDIPRGQVMPTGCQQIAQMIQQIAYTKIVEAIQQSNASLVVAYHRAGAPITTDLLYKACSASDNIEIVDYLIGQSFEIYQTILNDVSSNAPYRLAKANKFNQIAAYLKYRLSVECTKAIIENNLELVKKLVNAGASVELENTSNLNEAIQHQNLELIQFLCENGANMPTEWLSTKKILLDSAMSQQFTPEVTQVINRCLIEKRLRFAAANGDHDGVLRCLRLGVNINSANCHGSTALLCTIQHGNYFAIVHALVSRGASMLHSNENAPMSLIDLATQQNYKHIANYLSKQLNTQFLSTILNNDRTSAENFAQLGADFNYRDEQQRTPLHYAVQYHGIDLVAWLCECGSAPTICDVNGDFPIIQAVEKGDYAVVELFVLKYPATRKQMNKAGMTALQTAQKLKFNRIAQLIETGKGVPESENDEKTDGPLHDETTLIQAARNGHIKIIREFITQRYESKEEKKQLCSKLIQVARKASQYEVLDALEPYYKTELRTELASDMHADGNIVLSERYKQILFGFLGSLNNLISGNSVLLDPADPNTYKEFFVGLTDNVAKRRKELEQIKTEQDVNKLIQQDELHTKEQLSKIQEQLEELLEGKDNLQARLLDTDDRLFKEQKLTASQRKEFLKEKELHEQQLATYECSIFLFQRQQEATLNRQKAIDFLKSNINLMMFYRTIENCLEALFHSCLAAQGGYVRVEQTTKFGTAAKIVNTLQRNIPIINLQTTITKGLLSPVLSKLDERQQKKEFHNISTLGNIEELRRIASETAGLVTLYYNEQIQSIDTSQKIQGSNMFNEQLHWLKQIYDVRPETSEEMTVVMVAEYVTAWIIDGLKVGTNIIPTEPIPPQLWLHVAKKDPTDLGKINKITDTVGLSAGRQKIPVKVRNAFGKEITIKVQLRYLIGCVSVVGNDGSIYQYPVSRNNTDDELMELEYFGYVYVTPFSSDQKSLQSIVEDRKLHLAKRDNHGNILTRFQDIIQHAQTFINHHEQQQASKSLLTRETAKKVAEVLREERIFVDANAVKDQLKKAQEKIEVSVDVLREQIEEKASYYQVSIDAAHEQITKESQANREIMKKDNELRYDQALKKLNQHSEESEKRLEKFIEQRMNDIEQQLQNEAKRILSIAETAKAESTKAMAQARQANETSRQATENAAKAAKSAESLVKWSQERNEEFQRSMKNCEEMVQKTALAQKQACEEAITGIRTKFESDMERAREAVSKSAENAKESTRLTRQSESTMQDVQKMMKNQVEVHKTEVKKILAEAKESRQESERAANEAKEAQKQATRAAETSTTAIEKTNAIQTKMEKTIQQVEKLRKKLPASQFLPSVIAIDDNSF
ncbi:unnamed protein product [Adineta steineri]|uniref:Ankyrin repeat protein n=1 Tax=Adineta steineri TaxID=433720 RepID=A0A819DC35_9BILA|nr:unnamed protein product [Adineta steineri]